MLSPALGAMSQTVIDKTWTKAKDCMGVEGGTEERRDWSEAGRAEVSLEWARVEQVTVNEFHGTFAVSPDGNTSSLGNRTSKSSKFRVLVT